MRLIVSQSGSELRNRSLMLPTSLGILDVLVHLTSRDNCVCLASTLRFVSSRHVFWLIVLARFVLYLGIGHYLPSVSQHRSLSFMCGMQNSVGTGAEAMLMCFHEAADISAIYVCTSDSMLMALMLHVTCSGSR